MVQFNFAEKSIKAKVVYYGPAKSGKTTNLEQIHRLTDPTGHNSLVSLNTAQDRTLWDREAIAEVPRLEGEPATGIDKHYGYAFQWF